MHDAHPDTSQQRENGCFMGQEALDEVKGSCNEGSGGSIGLRNSYEATICAVPRCVWPDSWVGMKCTQSSPKVLVVAQGVSGLTRIGPKSTIIVPLW
jgi:hypothetical protein